MCVNILHELVRWMKFPFLGCTLLSARIFRIFTKEMNFPLCWQGEKWTHLRIKIYSHISLSVCERYCIFYGRECFIKCRRKHASLAFEWVKPHNANKLLFYYAVFHLSLCFGIIKSWKSYDNKHPLVIVRSNNKMPAQGEKISLFHFLALLVRPLNCIADAHCHFSFGKFSM